MKLSAKGLPVGSGFYWNNGKITAKVYIRGTIHHIATGTDKWKTALKIVAAKKQVLLQKVGANKDHLEHITIAEVFKDYINHLKALAAKRGEYAPETPNIVLASYNKHMRKDFGSLEEIDPAGFRVVDLEDTWLTNYGVRRAKEGACANTYNNKELANLRAALNLGFRNKKVDKDSIPSFHMIKKSDAMVGVRNTQIVDAQRDLILQNAPEWLKVIFKYCIYGTARKKEARFARRNNVDWGMERSKLNAHETKGGKTSRQIPLPVQILDDLWQWELKTRRDYANCPWLFHKNGEQLKSGTLDDEFDRTLLRAGLATIRKDANGRELFEKKNPKKPLLDRRVHWHDARRTGVTVMGALKDINDTDRGRVVGQSAPIIAQYDQNESADKIRVAMNKKAAQDKPAALEAPKPTPTLMLFTDAMREIARLHKDGILDDDEYKTAKMLCIQRHHAAASSVLS